MHFLQVDSFAYIIVCNISKTATFILGYKLCNPTHIQLDQTHFWNIPNRNFEFLIQTCMANKSCIHIIKNGKFKYNSNKKSQKVDKLIQCFSNFSALSDCISDNWQSI